MIGAIKDIGPQKMRVSSMILLVYEAIKRIKAHDLYVRIGSRLRNIRELGIYIKSYRYVVLPNLSLGCTTD